jgi:hypothetical protein
MHFYYKVWKFTIISEKLLLFLNFNCYLNFKYIVGLILINMPSALYFVFKYFFFNFTVKEKYLKTNKP